MNRPKFAWISFFCQFFVSQQGFINTNLHFLSARDSNLLVNVW